MADDAVGTARAFDPDAVYSLGTSAGEPSWLQRQAEALLAAAEVVQEMVRLTNPGGWVLSFEPDCQTNRQARCGWYSSHERGCHPPREALCATGW
jgi:hypothetical protein